MVKLEKLFDDITDEQLDQMIIDARRKLRVKEAAEREALGEAIKAELEAKKDKKDK